MIKVGVCGATGYTGYELVGILQKHPQVEITFTTSESYAGQRLSEVFPCPYDLSLVRLEAAPLDQVEVAFLCLPHAASMEAVQRVRAAGVRAIDLSADFRLADAATYERWYKTPHTAPELLPQAVYGLPEVHRSEIRGAGLVANPGCYPTSVILGLYPLVARGLLSERRIIVDAKSGVSGAGRQPSLTTHFVEANENVSPYSIGYAHRHISEMEQELNQAGGGPYHITFSPHLLPLNRGILSTMYVTVKNDWGLDRLLALYQEVYAGEPFIHILSAGQIGATVPLANLRYVVGTNRCAISITQVDDQGHIIVVSAIDNLLKGASGQAVQNMNVMLGLDEGLGLG
jgi:N-acetyl-gamma-glutamyl-phosphate reductase